MASKASQDGHDCLACLIWLGPDLIGFMSSKCKDVKIFLSIIKVTGSTRRQGSTFPEVLIFQRNHLNSIENNLNKRLLNYS